VSRGLETCGKTGASVFRPRRALDIHARSPAETGSGRAYDYFPTRFPRLGPPAGERYGCTPSGLTISSAHRPAGDNFVRLGIGRSARPGAATPARDAIRQRPGRGHDRGMRSESLGSRCRGLPTFAVRNKLVSKIMLHVMRSDERRVEHGSGKEPRPVTIGQFRAPCA